MVAIDYVPGFEACMAEAEPLVRYAAFVSDIIPRYRGSPALRSGHPALWALLEAEERRLRADHPAQWAGGAVLLLQLRS